MRPHSLPAQKLSLLGAVAGPDIDDYNTAAMSKGLSSVSEMECLSLPPR